MASGDSSCAAFQRVFPNSELIRLPVTSGIEPLGEWEKRVGKLSSSDVNTVRHVVNQSLHDAIDCVCHFQSHFEQLAKTQKRCLFVWRSEYRHGFIYEEKRVYTSSLFDERTRAYVRGYLLEYELPICVITSTAKVAFVIVPPWRMSQTTPFSLSSSSSSSSSSTVPCTAAICMSPTLLNPTIPVVVEKTPIPSVSFPSSSLFSSSSPSDTSLLKRIVSSPSFSANPRVPFETARTMQIRQCDFEDIHNLQSALFHSACGQSFTGCLGILTLVMECLSPWPLFSSSTKNV